MSDRINTKQEHNARVRQSNPMMLQKPDHAIKCVLYDRDCIGCFECEVCDLDPNKICDDCGKCLDIQDVASIKIDKIYQSEEEYESDNNN